MGRAWIVVLVSLLLMFLPEKCVSMPKCNFTDQSALLAFKAHISFDPQNILAHNWSSETSFCNWIGVSCSLPRQRVTTLNLSSMGFIGTIPPQIGNLSFLRFLVLFNNSFHGYIPREIGDLRRLSTLHMGSNSFSGMIPESYGNLTKLQKLHLDRNNLTGTIPSTIFNISSLRVIDLTFNLIFGSLPKNMCDRLPKLEFFSIYSNHFSGEIPSELYKCRELQSLYLSDNTLTGVIPEEIGCLSGLKVLNLAGNMLSGHIPSAIFNISSLQLLYLDANKLSGGLPTDICDHLPLLEELVLQGNQLSGQIPPSLCKCRQLRSLAMLGNNFDGNLPRDIGNLSMLTEMLFGSNMLEGSLPPSIGNLSRLEVLDLSSNRLTGHILQEFGNLRALRVLILHSNSFTNDPSSQVLHFITSLTNCRELQSLNTGKNPLNGMLPNSVGNLSSSLTYFYVNDCKLNGNIPSEIGNLSSLIGLALTKNNFAGSIPSTMEGLRNIQLLDLSRNKLNGSIPPFLCLARSLAVLAADENQLRGSIPNCIGNLTSLRLLYLDYNALSSTIPLTLWSLKDLLQLTLSSNSLSGPLALQVGGMKAAIVIDLSGNQLSGNIPSTIGSLQNLINISLSGNSFQGSIPESLGDLVGLELLNLSQNNLSGEIPKSLEDLRYLKYLNVSFNGLQGEIPSGGPFPNFTAQSFMGNKALCGPAWLQVPPCHRKSGQPSNTKSRLLRFILPAVASALLVVAFVFLLVRCPRRRRKTPIPEALPLTAIQRRVSFLELLRATNEFHESNLLGVGSFGSVYHGVLPDGLNIAVKIFNLQVQGGLRSFDTECEIMRNIRHRNLVKIICSCCNLDVKGLVLEYMPKGSLEKWLYSYNYFLDIIQRVNIMIDVASAIEYLHHGYSTPVVHCDLKPSNVLLDEDMVAHVCDFGIAKLLGESESVSQTKTLATIGYMAPEYGLDGLVSTGIDVYSFGIMLMEIFTRKRPTDEMFEGEMSLKRLVKESLPDSVIDIVDSNLLNRGDGHSSNKEHCVTSIMELALQCTKESPEERINMVEILARLKNIKGEFLTERERRRH